MEDIEDMFKADDATLEERVPQSKRKIVKKVALKNSSTTEDPK